MNSLGLSNQSLKDREIRAYMEEADIDVMSLTETNVKWSLVEEKDRIWARVSSWFENVRVAVGYNTLDTNASRDQRGGTALIIRGKLALTMTTGADESKLGRWTWVLIKGTNNTNTRIVSAYSPSGSGRGLTTVYSQQLSVLKDDPIRKFWEDLGVQLRKWTHKGERLILLGDWNEDITHPRLQEWMEAYGLKESILSLHGKNLPQRTREEVTQSTGSFHRDQ